MSDTEGYEGWTNRETWAVALWINNDQGWQESVHEAVREARDSDPDPLGITHGMADRCGAVIKDNVESLITADGYRETFGDAIPENLVKVAEDIGSLWRVDWTEIGAAFLRDLGDES